MSLISSIERLGHVLVGAAEQLANEITGHVKLPIPGLPSAPIGDIFTPVGADARAGADMIERVVDHLTGRVRIDANAARMDRPLLNATTIHVDAAGALQRLHVDATVAGADWGVAGRESGRMAVYVDGRYQSSVIVIAERSGGYTVDLGGLPAGDHQIELRAPDDVTGSRSPRVSVAAVTCETLSGDAALVARHSPILELQDLDPTAGNSTSHSDMPMLVVPAVTHHPDGTTTIAYRIAFSNEEGGTPSPKLLAEYGRTADLEPVYTVRLRADGTRIDAFYQSAVHSWRAFDGTYDGDRPVLRDCSENSMSSTRVHPAGSGAERWSPAPIPAVSGTTADFDVMSANPWTWTVMAKEILREGKALADGVTRSKNQVGDPRRYVFIGPLSDAQLGAITAKGGVDVVLADGRHVLARLVPGFANGPWKQGALELPSGALADAVTGIGLLGVRGAVFDQALRIRELPVAA
jgi:hypothetical protein